MQPKPVALSPAHWMALDLHELSLSGNVPQGVGHLLRTYARRLRRVGDRQTFHRSLVLLQRELARRLDANLRPKRQHSP